MPSGPALRAQLGLVPTSCARPPAPYVPAILFVILSNLLVQVRLFIESDKQMDAEGYGCYCGDRYRVGVSKNDPQANPPNCEAQVHRVSDVAVETDHHQSLGWSDRRRLTTLAHRRYKPGWRLWWGSMR